MCTLYRDTIWHLHHLWNCGSESQGQKARCRRDAEGGGRIVTAARVNRTVVTDHLDTCFRQCDKPRPSRQPAGKVGTTVLGRRQQENQHIFTPVTIFEIALRCPVLRRKYCAEDIINVVQNNAARHLFFFLFKPGQEEQINAMQP